MSRLSKENLSRLPKESVESLAGKLGEVTVDTEVSSTKVTGFLNIVDTWP